MEPLNILGKELKEDKSELGVFVVEGIFQSLEEGERQQYSVESKDGTWELSLDSSNRITAVFIYLNKGHSGIHGINAKMSKDDILTLFGSPEYEGTPHIDPFLGECGAWEKYRNRDHYLHIEHENNYTGVKMVTFMVIDADE